MGKWLLRFIGIIIFIVILTRIDVKEVIKIWGRLNIFYAALPVFFTFLHLFFAVFRWRILLKAQRIELGWKEAFLIYTSGLFWGLATPGRIGEFSKVFYLKEKGYSLGKSLPNIVIDRFLDVLLLFLVAYFGMVYLSHIFARAIVIIISLWLFFQKEIRNKIMRKIFNRIIPLRMKAEARQQYQTFCSELKDLDRNKLLEAILITGIIWLFQFVLIYILAGALGITIPFLSLSIFYVIAALVAAVPISVAGIGTRDLVLILLFAQVGLNRNLAISFSLLIVYLNLILLVVGFLAWHIKPIRIGQNPRES